MATAMVQKVASNQAYRQTRMGVAAAPLLPEKSMRLPLEKSDSDGDDAIERLLLNYPPRTPGRQGLALPLPSRPTPSTIIDVELVDGNGNSG